MAASPAAGAIAHDMAELPLHGDHAQQAVFDVAQCMGIHHQVTVHSTAMKVVQTAWYLVGHNGSHQGVEIIAMVLPEGHHLEVTVTGNSPINEWNAKVVRANTWQCLLLLMGANQQIKVSIELLPVFTQQSLKYGRF